MFKDAFIKLFRALYPQGRAFRIPFGFNINKLHQGISIGNSQVYKDSKSILDSILPDNDNFTEEDAEDWERRLGLVSNPFVLLENRKAAILRKYEHPGTIKARQHYLYLERELQNANFDVYVHENRFFELGMWITKTPAEVIGATISGAATHNTNIQHGQVNHGGGYSDKIVNSLDPEVDAVFDEGSNLRSTFFIGGAVLGEFAVIDAERLQEFRQLVLKIKPVQTVAYLILEPVNADFNEDFNEDFNV